LIDEATPKDLALTAVAGGGPKAEVTTHADKAEKPSKPRVRKVSAVEKKVSKKDTGASSKALLEAIKTLLEVKPQAAQPREPAIVKAEEWEVEVIERDAEGRTKRLRFLTK
jgi:hypothetical protein